MGIWNKVMKGSNIVYGSEVLKKNLCSQTLSSLTGKIGVLQEIVWGKMRPWPSSIRILV